MRLIFDIETDGLLDEMTTIHSLCMLDIVTGKRWSCTDHKFKHPDGYEVLSVRAGLQLLMEADEIIGHNIIKFDIPAIQKVHPWFSVPRTNVTDTLIHSRLIYANMFDQDVNRRNKISRALKKKNPELAEDFKLLKEAQNKVYPARLMGSHGLEAWGYRMDEWKGDYKAVREAELKQKHEDEGLPAPTKDELTNYVWGTWNVDMQLYCDVDINVNHALFQKFEAVGYAPRAIEIERDFAWILAEMERNGFPFDMEKALKTQAKLMKRQAQIKLELAQAFQPITETWEFTPKANNSKLGYVKGETITKSKEIVFNPSSRQHIAKWLTHKYGWKPKLFTDGNDPQPKIDEKVLKALPYPEAKMLAEYFLLDKRLGMLEGKMGRGLIPSAKKGNGRIHGGVNTIGAVTRRCTHASPNMAQIPAVNVPFGKDFREMLCAPEGWVLLGWDASGLELRCFAHYMSYYDGGKYTSVVLDGDIHWTHVKALALVEADADYDEHDDKHNHARNKVAKRFIYAYLYGAGPELIGEIVLPNGTPAQKKKAGKKLTDEFLKRTPALKKLKRDLQKRLKKAPILTAIDGGALHVRSQHSALNTLLQSAGAVAVKLATILYYDMLIEKGLVSGEDFMLVAHVHDEVQTLVKKGKEEIVGQTAVEAMRKAGELLGFKCPLDGEWKAGANWAETH